MNIAADIIVVDDDPSVREAIAEYLAPHGFSVRTAESGAALERQRALRRPDLVVLDVMMPGETGIEVCRRLVDTGIRVLMLSALSETADKVLGLEVGADDYLQKPFEPRELLARIRTLLRRDVRAAHGGERWRFEGWTYEPERRDLRDPEGAAVALTANEHALLTALLQAGGRVLSRDQLLDASDRGGEPIDRAVDLALSRLRRKLGAGAGFVETVRGAGYRFAGTARRVG